MMRFRDLLIPMTVGAVFLIGAETAPVAAETWALAEPDAIMLVDGKHRGRQFGPARRHWRGQPPRFYAPPPPRYYAPKPGVGLYFRF